MRKSLLLIVAATLALAACKTTEANYRAAYETAKEKKASGLGDEVDNAMAKEEQPRETKVGDATLPVLNARLYAADAEGADAITPKIYSVAVAKFKQIFNARSLCSRLRDGGFSGAFVAVDRDKNYYVLTGTTAEATEAAKILAETEQSEVFKAKTPFPCVIVSR